MHAKRVLVLLAVVLAALAVAPPVATSGTAPLLPDLRPRRPGDPSRSSSLFVQRKDGRRYLRLEAEVRNLGIGPLEIRSEAGDCDPTTEADEGVAWQRVYEDAESADGIFTRGHDTEATETRVGCVRYHEAHKHWHLDDFAQYDLMRFGPNGRLTEPVASSDKVSFCLLDTYRRRPDLAGSPDDPYFLQPYCQNQSDRATGISVGWADVYQSLLPGQELDITGLPNGKYCLRTTIDPVDKLTEQREGNNWRGRRIWLTKSGFTYARVKGCLPG